MKTQKFKLLIFCFVVFSAPFLSESLAGSFSPFSSSEPPSLSQRSLVDVSAAADPSSVFPGTVFRLHVQVVISSGSHIYSLTEGVEEDLATKVLVSQPSLQPKGEWQESPPQIIFDDVLQRAVKTHENIAEFIRDFAAPLESFDEKIVGSLIYRLCDNRTCSMPKTAEFETPIRIE